MDVEYDYTYIHIKLHFLTAGQTVIQSIYCITVTPLMYKIPYTANYYLVMNLQTCYGAL